MAKKENATGLATFDQSTAAVVRDVSKLKLKKHVVIPTISIDKMKAGDILYIEAMGEIRYVEQKNEDGTTKIDEKTGEVSMLPLLTVTRSDTGEFGQIVLASMVHSAMKEEGALVGRLFALRKGEPKSLKGGAKMNLWEVVELSE